MSNFAKSKHAPTNIPSNTNIKCTDKAKLIPKRVEVSKFNQSNSMYTHAVVIFQTLPKD